MHHIETRCGITLDVARPFSMEWDGAVSLWSNYDMKECCLKSVRSRRRFHDIVAKLKEAIHEGGQQSDIEWRYEWDNPIVSSLHFWDGMGGTLLTARFRNYLRALSRLG